MQIRNPTVIHTFEVEAIDTVRFKKSYNRNKWKEKKNVVGATFQDDCKQYDVIPEISNESLCLLIREIWRDNAVKTYKDLRKMLSVGSGQQNTSWKTSN